MAGEVRFCEGVAGIRAAYLVPWSGRGRRSDHGTLVSNVWTVGGHRMETFVVRVWRPAAGLDAADAAAPPSDVGDLHGTILHPATGKETAFTNADELLRALQGDG